MTEREFLTTYSHGWSWDKIEERIERNFDPVKATETTWPVLELTWRVDGVRVLFTVAKLRGRVAVSAMHPTSWPLKTVQKNPPPGLNSHRFESPYTVFDHKPVFTGRQNPKKLKVRPVYFFLVPTECFADPGRSHEIQQAIEVVVVRVRREVDTELALDASRAAIER